MRQRPGKTRMLKWILSKQLRYRSPNTNQPRVITFLCKGNICRSPYGEVRLRQLLANDTRFHVNSCGWYATPGRPANPQAISVSADFGIDLAGHRTSDLSDIGASDLIVLFEPRHILKLPLPLWKRCVLLPIYESRLPRSLKIPDPFGKSDATFRQCYSRIDTAIERLSLILKEET